MKGRDYQAFGLQIRSEVPLVAFAASGQARPDISVRRAPLQRIERSLQSFTHATPQSVQAYWIEFGAFTVTAGADVVLDPNPELTESAVAAWLQGAILSIALHQRGLFVLHASAVVIDGRAIAFAGDCGAGKSTTVSAFHAAGFAALTDDLLVIDIADKPPTVRPGMPQVKLLPDAAAHLGVSASETLALDADPEKRMRPIHAGWHSDSVPLGAICVLEGSPTIELTPMPPQAALANLLRHAFVAKQTAHLQKMGTTQQHFRACTTVVNEVSLFFLRRPRDFRQLGRVVQTVAQRFTTLAKERAKILS